MKKLQPIPWPNAADGKRLVIPPNKMVIPSAATRRLLTDRQAAEYLGICSRTIHNLVARKQLPTLKIGRARRFDVEDLNAFIASRKVLPSGWKSRQPAKPAAA